MKMILTLTWSILVVALIWSLWKVTNLETEYSMDQFFPKEHALLKDHEKISHQFRLNNSSPYLIALEVFEEEGWLQAQRIEKLKTLVSEIQSRPDTAQIIALTQIEGASSGSEEMIIGNIFDRTHPTRWKGEIRKNSLLYPVLITEDFRSTLLVIESSLKNQKQLKAFEEDLFNLISSTFPDVRIHQAGVPLLQSRLSDIIQNELTRFLVYISIGFCGIFYLIFSHWTAIVSAFLTLIVSNIFGLGLMVTFQVPMNALLVTLPVIISVSIMSLLIHTLHLWARKDVSGKIFFEKTELAKATIKELGLPNALGILTTALGFLTLGTSPIPLISEYGLIVAMILALVSLLAQIMMFLLLPLVTPRMRAWLDRPAYWALWAVKHPLAIAGPVLVLTLSGAFLLSSLNFSFKLFDDLPSKDPIRLTTDWIDKSFGGIVTFDIEAKSIEEGHWKKPESLLALKKLSESLKRLPNIRNVVSVPDFFQGPVPQKKAQIAETFFLFSMAEKNPLNSFMTEDGKSLRLAIRLTDISSRELEETKRIIREECRTYFPKITFVEGGMASYAHIINQEVARALIFDFWQPLLLIGIVLLIVFRSFKWALLACTPNFIPPMVLVAALVVTGAPVKPGVALIFSIAMGFAFNNTLYLLSRLRSLEEKQEGHALEKALVMEANPCLLESFVMFAGFSIFLFSEFKMNQTFGGFMLISIMAGFTADLLFLPAFLKLCPFVYRKKFKIPARSLATIAIFLLSAPSYASQDAREILKKSQTLLESKDDEAKVEMKIIEENGEIKTRSLVLKTLRNEGFSVIARIEAPLDIKDMAFLGKVNHEGDETQWIYLPSSGQVRRLVTGKTKAGVLGSEISPEDLNSEAIRASSVKLQKIDDKYFWIELTPKPEASEYSKVVTKISKDDLLPKFTMYYLKDKIKKTVSFKDYKKIGQVFRAHTMLVQNHLNGRATEVVLSSIRVNSGLRAEDFTQTNLKE
jgi:uncharacterized protein